MGMFHILRKTIQLFNKRKTEHSNAVVPPPLSTTLTPLVAVVPPPLSTTVTPQIAVVPPPLSTTSTPHDAVVPPPLSTTLTPQDARKILEPFTKQQLLDLIQTVLVQDFAVLDAVHSIADADPSQRKLFIRGIAWETTTDTLRSVFSTYGELDEVKLITDKNTGKSKGYGFVTFKYIDSAILALKEPRKKIDGRITVAQLAASRESGSVDVSTRKIYVGNVPFEISSERLLSHFSSYGEIEKGPLGFNKQLGGQKGFAFFVYKTEEGARNSVAESVKNIDGHRVVCKMANVGKKGKAGGLPSYGGQILQILRRQLVGLLLVAVAICMFVLGRLSCR